MPGLAGVQTRPDTSMFRSASSIGFGWRILIFTEFTHGFWRLLISFGWERDFDLSAGIGEWLP